MEKENKEVPIEQKVLEDNIVLSKELKIAITNLKGIKFLSILVSVLMIVIVMKQMGWI